MYFSLLSICNDRKDMHIKLLVDNTTAVAYIREQGGSHSLECNKMVRKIWTWAYERNIWLTAAHIPGKINCKADFESRHFKEEYEWMLDKQVFQSACQKLNFMPDIDLFATRNNCQLEKFVSWKPEPESFAIDAFSISWAGINLYCFPPFSLIPSVLQKIVLDQAIGILIMPDWPTQPYYATVMKMLIEHPIFVHRRKTLLCIPGTTKIHKIWEKLNLLICLLSGDQSKVKSYRNKLKTFCCHHGGKKQQNNMSVTSGSGRHSVVDGKLIPFQQL